MLTSIFAPILPLVTASPPLGQDGRTLLGILCGIPLILIASTAYWVSRRWTKRSHSKPQPAKPNNDDPTIRLKQLRQMLDEGLISETDFESKKADVLADL